jgi:hypothetical protein
MGILNSCAICVQYARVSGPAFVLSFCHELVFLGNKKFYMLYWGICHSVIPTTTEFPAARCSLATLMHFGRCSHIQSVLFCFLFYAGKKKEEERKKGVRIWECPGSLARTPTAGDISNRMSTCRHPGCRKRWPVRADAVLKRWVWLQVLVKKTRNRWEVRGYGCLVVERRERDREREAHLQHQGRRWCTT